MGYFACTEAFGSRAMLPEEEELLLEPPVFDRLEDDEPDDG